MNPRNRFSRYNQPVRCVCGKLTTQTVGGGTELCRACYDAAGLENEHNDNGHAERVKGCPVCEVRS